MRDLRNQEGPGQQDVEFSYSSEVADNSDIKVDIGMVNTAAEARTVVLTVNTSACYYTGVVGEHLALETMQVDLKPGESKY